MLIQISTVSMLAAQKTHFQQKKELHRLSETPLLILLDSIYSKSHSGVKYAPVTPDLCWDIQIIPEINDLFELAIVHILSTKTKLHSHHFKDCIKHKLHCHLILMLPPWHLKICEDFNTILCLRIRKYHVHTRIEEI